MIATTYWRRVALCAGLFGLIGPFLGGLVVLSVVCSFSTICRPADGSFIEVLPPAFYLSYLTGGMAAVITGALSVPLAEHAYRGWAHLLKAALVGGVVSGVCAGIQQMTQTSLIEVLISGTPALLFVGAVGAVASIPSTMLALWLGVLRTVPKPRPVPA